MFPHTAAHRNSSLGKRVALDPLLAKALAPSALGLAGLLGRRAMAFGVAIASASNHVAAKNALFFHATSSFQLVVIGYRPTRENASLKLSPLPFATFFVHLLLNLLLFGRGQQVVVWRKREFGMSPHCPCNCRVYATLA